MEHKFTLTVTGTEHGEWQGRIQMGNEPPQEFEGLLDMIKMMKKGMEEEA